MDIVIYHKGIFLAEYRLDPSVVYKIGRSKDCNIPVLHPGVKFEVGELYYSEGHWYFRNKNKVEKLNETLSLSGHLEIYSKDYLQEVPSFSFFFVIKHHMAATLSAFVSVILLAGCFFGYKHFTRPMNSNELLSFVSSKVVEFEFEKNEKAYVDMKKYAKLEDKDFQDKVGYCTGFLVGPGIVLTANHCFNLGRIDSITSKFYMKTSDGKKHKANRVLGLDKKRDYLFLEVDSLKGYDYLKYSTNHEVGQKVFTIGNVGGEGIAIRDGIISGETEDKNHPEIKFIRYSAAASPGNSGGPLVNERGNIVGIVFARNHSENYNLGTDSKFLISGHNKFVKNRDKKDIEFDPMSGSFVSFGTGYKVKNFYRSLNLPLPEALNERPELMRTFDDVNITLSLPDTVDGLISQIINRSQELAIKKLSEVKTKILEDKLPYQMWNEMVTDDLPLIVANLPTRPETIFKKNKNYIFPEEFSYVHSGDYYTYRNSLDKWQNEKIYSFYGMSYKVPRIKSRISKKDMPKDGEIFSTRVDSRKSDRFEFFSMSDIFYNSLSTDLFPTVPSLTENYLKKVYQGRSSLIFDTRFFKFIRPKSHRSFKMDDFIWDIEKVTSIDDNWGRTWEISKWSYFDQVEVYEYCTSISKGVFCQSDTMGAENNEVFPVFSKNFVKYQLSDKVFDDFYTIDQTLKLMGDHKNRLPHLVKDFSVDKNGEQVEITFKSTGFNFKIGNNSEKIESLRFLSGVMSHKEKSKWTALGIEAVVNNNGKRSLCSIGHELNGITHMDVLDQKKEKSKGRFVAGKSARGLIKSSDVYRKKWKSKLGSANIYSYCLPFKLVEGEKFKFYPDYEEVTPYKLNF